MNFGKVGKALALAALAAMLAQPALACKTQPPSHGGTVNNGGQGGEGGQGGQGGTGIGYGGAGGAGGAGGNGYGGEGGNGYGGSSSSSSSSLATGGSANAAGGSATLYGGSYIQIPNFPQAPGGCAGSDTVSVQGGVMGSTGIGTQPVPYGGVAWSKTFNGPKMTPELCANRTIVYVTNNYTMPPAAPAPEAKVVFVPITREKVVYVHDTNCPALVAYPELAADKAQIYGLAKSHRYWNHADLVAVTRLWKHGYICGVSLLKIIDDSKALASYLDQHPIQ
ncbi:MAG: hypothetical protein WAN50_01635 [Minisyncoccia bacterium]